MPDPKDFLRGFGLSVGRTYGGFELENIEIEHHTVSQFQEYSFPIRLTFTPLTANDPERLLSTLRKSLSGRRIINSHYGNPYLCTIVDIELHGNGTYETVTMIGRAVRIR